MHFKRGGLGGLKLLPMGLKSVLLISFMTTASGQDFIRMEDQAGLGHLTDNNGVAVADYDRDGDLDIFMVGFWSFDDQDETTWNRLLKNNGDATFADVTLAAGFDRQFVNTSVPAARGEKMGASWGDYDNDGYPDLFLTNSREDELYHNEGDGSFVNVTEQAGVVGCHECYTSSGLWWDPDRDGDLDLYVSRVNGNNIMYENKGDGTFDEVTSKFRLSGAGITWTSVAIDANQDGFLDLYLANDTQENQFFENQEGSIFLESTGPYGLADEGAGMGVTVGDYNNDGLFDIYVTNIFNHHPNPLYTQLPEKNYRDDARAMGVEDTGWGWGTHFFDCDHDGDLDLYAVNGVEEKGILFNEEQVDVNNFFFKSLFMEGTESFEDFSVGSATAGSARARGLEVFDYDDDGDLDLLVANSRDKPYLYRNEIIKDEQPESKNWIKIWLEGTDSNRDAYGTEVIAIIDGKTYHRWHHGAAFLGQSSKPVHFGLGSAELIDEIRITWPSGLNESVYDIPVNQTLSLREGDNTRITGVQDDILKSSIEAYNYPNPFDVSTTLRFNVTKTGTLDVKIFSIIGEEVYTTSQLVSRSGEIQISWQGSDVQGENLSPGLYFYTAELEKDRAYGKMVKIR